MDFADFDRLYEDEPIPVQLAGPDNKPLRGTDGEPVWLYLLPPECPAVEKATEEVRARRQARADDGELTAEDKAAFETELLAAMVRGWSDNVLWEGEPFPYTPHNAAKLISTKGGKMLRRFLLQWRFDQGNAWAALRAQRARGADGADASTESTKTPASPASKNSKPRRKPEAEKQPTS